MYFRTRYSSFEEFQRDVFDYGGRELGKDELELIDELRDNEEQLIDAHRKLFRRDYE